MIVMQLHHHDVTAAGPGLAVCAYLLAPFSVLWNILH